MELYPVVLEHAAAFVRRSPWELSRSAELLAAAHMTAFRFYRQRPVVCGLDVYNVEAEAWGATVERPDGNGVPTLGNPPLSNVSELAQLRELDPERAGRLPLLFKAARQIRSECPDADVRIPLAGPFSIAVGMLGFENMLVALMEEPGTVADGLLHLARHQAQLAAWFGARGFSVNLYESAATPPLVPPEIFRDVELPALRIIFNSAPMGCVLGGDVTAVASDLLGAGPKSVICPAETDQAAFLASAAAWPGIPIRVNLPAAVMACGDRERIFAAIRETAVLARRHPHASLGTGVLPYEADPELVQAARVFAGSLG